MKFKRVLASVLSSAMLCSMATAAMPAGAAGAGLADKISAAGNGATVALDKDYTEAISIASGKKLTLDLNGHTLSSSAAYVIQNSGELTVIDSAGGGKIERTAVSGNTTGIQNEASGVLTVKSGAIEVTTTERDVASAILNKGRIAEISGGDIIAKTPGSTYSYGIWNDSGTIDLISGGYFYGGITEFNKNGNNAMAINNGGNGKIGSITGGIFVGEVRTGGGGYGIRNDGTVSSVSGGAFQGNTSGNAVYQRGGTYTYADNCSLSSKEDGIRVVLEKGQHYVALLDENETPVAVYILDKDGKVVKAMGHTSGSYSVYQNGSPKTMTEAEIAKIAVNTTLTVCTDQEKPVWYFLGSSVTYGSNNSGNSYADFLEDDYDVTVVKKAVSGTTLVEQGGSYISRMRSEISKNAKIDHLIVQLSTNDASQNKPLGVCSDSFASGDQDTSTVIGAIEYIIAYAYETWGCDVTFWTNPWYANDNYAAMYNAIFQIQEKWDIGVLDYYADGKPAEGTMSDDIHPNETGYRNMTPIAWEYLSNFKNGDENIDQKHVDAVVALIGKIGAVSATSQSLAKIMDAKEAYNALTVSEKKAVTNAGVLKTAYATYCSLYTAANDGKLLDFDFAGESLEEAGGRLTATADSAVTFKDGKDSGSKAAHFDASQKKQGVKWDTADYNPLSGAGDQITISTWIYLDAKPADNSTVFMTKGISGTDSFGFMLLKANGGSYQMCVRPVNGGEIRLTSRVAPVAGRWTLVSYVQDGNIGKLYIDGALQSQSVMPTAASTFTDINGVEYLTKFALGCQLNWDDPSLPGAMDSFTIYKGALSDVEIAELYAPGSAADYEKYNKLADEDGGRMVYMDFEKGAADSKDRFNPIVGSAVSLDAAGKDSGKAASFTNTKSVNSMLRWKQDEYDPFLYADKGASISMWVNFKELANDSVLFNYGFWGYRFILARSGDDLLVSARNYDSTTKEFKVAGLKDLVGAGWAHLTLTVSADKTYTVYLNGKEAGSQTLDYSLYDLAKEGAATPKRNTANESNQYYGYYAIGGAPYWADRNNMVGSVDDFAIYNKVLSTKEIMKLSDPSLTVDQAKVDNATALIAKIGVYSDTFYADLAKAREAFDALTDYEKANVENAALLDCADATYCNGLADKNGGKYVNLDFEDGTAGDAADRMTPIVGSEVSIVNGGNFGSKSAKFTDTKSVNSMIRWKQDEYDPMLYAKNGTTISMWLNAEALNGDSVLFNYGFWGYRFVLQKDGNKLRVSARNYDSTTSEFSVAGLDKLVGSGWSLLTVTCDADKVYSVYFNGKLAGRQALSFSLYDLAAEAARTAKRNTTDENNQYYGYYSIGGASYWADKSNLVGTVDDFALYNRALGADEISAMYNVTDVNLLAKQVMNQIDAIGTVDFTIKCGQRIEAARAAFDKASGEVRALVTNAADLEKAEKEYAALFENVRVVDNATEVTAISGPGSGNESFEKMFDGDVNTKFGNGNYTTPFIWKVSAPVKAQYYSLTTGADSGVWAGRNPVTWRLYGSNDYDEATGNANWSEIAAVDDNHDLPDANSVEVRFGIDHPAEYRYYKFELPSQGDKWMQLSELSLYAAYEPADYTAVDTAIAKADALTKELYKDFSGVTAAIDAVVRGKDASEQTVVDGYATAIEKAIDALEYKDADYTAVDAAILKVDGLTKADYADFSGVTAAVNAVVRGKNITEQAIVDGYATAIEDAIKALKRKGDFTGEGELTITDVMEACRVLARKSAGIDPTPEEIKLGDLNGDTYFTITDIMMLCKILASK